MSITTSFFKWIQLLKDYWSPSLLFFDAEPDYDRLGQEWDFLRQENKEKQQERKENY
jgi:hypothetical protein